MADNPNTSNKKDTISALPTVILNCQICGKDDEENHVCDSSHDNDLS